MTESFTAEDAQGRRGLPKGTKESEKTGTDQDYPPPRSSMVVTVTAVPPGWIFRFTPSGGDFCRIGHDLPSGFAISHFEVKIPNALTRDTLEKAEQGIDLHTASSVEEFFKELES